ncbi:MAG: class I SAM-dependent methyltransferase [Planctomycetota bacterium]
MSDETNAPWFGDDSFWGDLYPYLFGHDKEESAAQQVASAVTLTGRGEGRALDLCCGSGRHLVPLARQGFAVTGVDLNPGQLERSRTRIEAAGVDAELVQADMRAFCRRGTFDLILSMFNSLGYFEDEAEDVTVLSQVRESLTPGGACFLELISKEFLARTFTPETVVEEVDGSRLERRIEVLDGWHRIRNHWRLTRGEQTRDFVFEQSIYSGREMESMMRSAGFAEIELYGSLEGAPYDHAVERLIVVGRQ